MLGSDTQGAVENGSRQDAEAPSSSGITAEQEDLLFDGDDSTSSPLSVILATALHPSNKTKSSLVNLLDTYKMLEVEQENYCDWADVDDDLAVLVSHRPHALALFRSVYRIGVQQARVLKALAYLVNNQQYTEESLRIMASYFSLSQVSDVVRLACIRLLIVLKSPIDAGWQVEEAVLNDTLDFVMQSSDWEFLQHSEKALLYNLRTMIQDIQEHALGQLPSTTIQPSVKHDSAYLTPRTSPAAALVPSLPIDTGPQSNDIERPGPDRSRRNLRELEQQFKNHSIISPRRTMVNAHEESPGVARAESRPVTYGIGAMMGCITAVSASITNQWSSVAERALPSSRLHKLEGERTILPIDDPVADVWNLQLSQAVGM
jgi:hypothetical protein